MHTRSDGISEDVHRAATSSLACVVIGPRCSDKPVHSAGRGGLNPPSAAPPRPQRRSMSPRTPPRHPDGGLANRQRALQLRAPSSGDAFGAFDPTYHHVPHAPCRPQGVPRVHRRLTTVATLSSSARHSDQRRQCLPLLPGRCPSREYPLVQTNHSLPPFAHRTRH
jgi:hypothetical protein